MAVSDSGEMFKDLGAIDRFRFSLDTAVPTRNDIDLRVSAIEDRIQRLTNKVVFNHVPILMHILSVSSDPKDLIVIARALDKLAELVPQLKDLQDKQKVVQTAFDNPQWMASVFGDFSGDFDTSPLADQADNR